MSWKVKKLHEEAKLPTLANPGDRCYDISCVSDPDFQYGSNDTKIYTMKPGERKLFSTGISFELPYDYSLILKSRSGNALRKGLDVKAGVIDSSFRNEISILLKNDSNQEQIITSGDRIAQAKLEKNIYYEPQWAEDELTVTTRNINGWGSTGE